MLLQSRIPIESLAHPVAYNIHFGKGFLLTHWKNLLMRRSSRENLCKKRYCDVPKTNRFVLKILEKLNHFVLKVRTGGFADSKCILIVIDGEKIIFFLEDLIIFATNY